MYEHRYKHGKQKTIMPNVVFEAAMQDAINQGEPLEYLAYVTLLWHTGVRKSEAYERLLSDVTVTKKFVVVDFHKRKKGGEEVPALNIPRSFYGVELFLLCWISKRQKAKPPHRASWKSLKKQVETGEYRQTEPTGRNPNGVRVSVKKTVSEKKRDIWLFPHVASTSAWRIVKRILGAKYYPHYLRLRKLSRVGSNPKTKSIVHLKSLSGLKSISAIGAYMGFDKDIQDEAMSENE